MAYRNLLEVACADRAELFKRLRDFVCRRNGSYDYSTTGIGWTLHDSGYAVDQNTITNSDWFVIYSPGEGGSDDLYFKITTEANWIHIVGYLYWNAATNTGIEMYGGTNSLYVTDSDVPVLWIYGDLDQLLVVSRPTDVSTSFYEADFGKALNDVLDATILSSGSAISSGTDVVVTLSAVPAAWKVGDKVFFRDTVRSGLITIKAKTSTTITVDLADSYLSGTKISAELGYYCVYNNTGFASYVALLIDHTGYKNSVACMASGHSQITAASLDPVNAGALAAKIFILGPATGYHGHKRNVLLRASTGVTDLSVYQDASANNYRAFTFYSGVYGFVREV